MAIVTVWCPRRWYSLSQTAVEKAEAVGHYVLSTSLASGGFQVRTACGKSLVANPFSRQTKRVPCQLCERSGHRFNAAPTIVIDYEDLDLQRMLNVRSDAVKNRRKKPTVTMPPPETPQGEMF